MNGVRNHGALLLAKTGKTSEEIGARCGVSRALASHWLSGQRTPTKLRRSTLKKQFAIPLTAWDRDAEPNAEPKAAPLMTIEDAWRDLELTALQQTSEAKDPNTPPGERGRLAKNAAHTLQIIGRQRRLMMSERAILKMPSWQRIKETIFRVLEAHPEIALELEAKLAEFEQ